MKVGSWPPKSRCSVRIQLQERSRTYNLGFCKRKIRARDVPKFTSPASFNQSQLFGWYSNTASKTSEITSTTASGLYALELEDERNKIRFRNNGISEYKRAIWKYLKHLLRYAGRPHLGKNTIQFQVGLISNDVM